MNKRQITRIIQVLILVTITYFGINPNIGGVKVNLPALVDDNGYYSVIKVYDGDTIEVDMAGTPEKIRMIGVNTPETHDPRKPVECFGQAASDYTHSQLDSRKVRLQADPINQNRDRYDRLLRYVYLEDGSLYNAQLIREGYGFAYTHFPFTKSSEFIALEKQAREQNKGLWASCPPQQG